MNLSLAVFLSVLGLCFFSMAIYGARHDHSAHDPLESTQRGTFVLGPFVRSWFLWIVGPPVGLALKAGLTPLFFNLLGVAGGAAAGLAFALGSTVGGGWLILFGGIADVFDGRIARTLGIASPKGAFLDSTLDRFAEVGMFAGLAIYFHARPLMAMTVALALGGSLLVSYARARGESQGVVCKVGVMQRTERILLVGFAGILDPSISAWAGESQGTFLALIIALIAVGTIGTAIYRTVWITHRLSDAEAQEPVRER